MPDFVADASICLAWCFPDESNPMTEALLDRLVQGEEIAVPCHWRLEVLNAVIQGEKRGRISEPMAKGFLARLLSFRIEIDGRRELSHLETLRELAQRHRLTAYDAAYLELAMRLGLPLASLDGDLIRAAQAEKVPLI